MKSGFVTAADVARRAGVSRSAVSRTFTAGGCVSEKVRDQVLKAAEELGYRVNRLAQELQTSQSNLVGVVGANLATPFIAAQLDALSAALLQRGLQCLLLNANGAQNDIGALVNRILEYRVRAIVVLSGAPPAGIIDQCVKNHVRLILINRGITAGNADRIDTDDFTGGRLAAERLLRDGCRRVAAIRSGADSPSQRRRAEGFTNHMEAAGVQVTQWVSGKNSYEAGFLAARALVPGKMIDGAFCITDRVALGFLNTARFEFSVKIPQDLSIIGFDDIPESSWPSHELTTIRQPIAPFIEAVMKSLSDERDPADGAYNFTVPVKLIERSTTTK